MAGVMHVAWYATLFRGDKLQAALEEIAPISLRYGATEYAIYRSQDDKYKLLQMSTFADHSDWERYWYGEEFSLWRAENSSFYQVPQLYIWHDLVVRGGIGELEGLTAPNGG